MNRFAIALVTLASLLTAGCTADEPSVAVSGQRAISLSAYASRQLTRGASVVSGGIPDGQSIGIYAYYHKNATWSATATPNFMWNQRAVSLWYDDQLSYSPLKYWPNSEHDKLSFMAYYPYVASGTVNGVTPLLPNDGIGLPTFRLTVDDDADRETDLLVSDLIANLPRSRDTSDAPGTPFNDLTIQDRVRFVFHHATAMVEFRVVVDPHLVTDLAHFKINSLVLTNITKEGTLQPVYESSTGTTTLTWTPTMPAVRHDYDFTTYEPRLLLPQALGDDALFKLDYEMTFKSSQTVYTYDGTMPQRTDAYTYRYSDVAIQLNTLCQSGTTTPVAAWLPDHHYIYTIRLQANRIDFTAEVAPWGDYNWITIS